MRFWHRKRHSRGYNLSIIGVLLVFTIAGNYIEFGIREDFMSENIKLVKRLDDVNSIGSSIKRSGKKLLKRILEKSFAKGLKKSPKRREFSIVEYRRSQTRRYRYNRPQRIEMSLYRVERFDVKKNSQPIIGKDISGVLEIEGSNVVGFIVSSVTPDIDIYFDSPTKIANNYAFTYEHGNGIYSATVTKQKGGKEYIVNLSNGPFAHVKLSFASEDIMVSIQESLETLKNRKLAEKEKSQKREISALRSSRFYDEELIKKSRRNQEVTEFAGSFTSQEIEEELEEGTQEFMIMQRNKIQESALDEEELELEEDLVLSSPPQKDFGYKF